MNCPRCGAEIDENVRFCGKCGNPVAAASQLCSKCGAETERGARFCRGCGAPQDGSVGQAPSPTAAERAFSAQVSRVKQNPPKRVGSGGRLVSLIVLLVVAAAAYLFLFSGDSPSKPASSSGAPGAPTPGQQAKTPGTPGAGGAAGLTGKALGAATFKAPDPSTLVNTQQWGQVPAGYMGIVLKDGLGRSDADSLVKTLGARIVGEFGYLGLYQIETGGKNEADLKASLDKAKAASSVALAFPLTLAQPDGDIAGQQCAPLTDQTYDGVNGIPYKMIGVENAWQILRASGVELSPVKVAITDDGLYKGKGEFSGLTKFETPDKEDALSAALKDSGVEDPKGSHGTAVASIVGADPDNGGIAGVASVLGDKLSVSMSNVFGSQYGTNKQSKPDPKDPTRYTSQGQTYSIGPLAAMQKQIDGGATIINASWGNSNADLDEAKAYRKFFEKMSKDHPEVLFVTSAGNDGKALDGSKRYPSGANLPNMITVGNVENDGSRRGTSNMAGKDFEVTLAAPGHGVPSGRGPDGKISNVNGGTSFATPQVTSAAAMLRAINPKLTAGEIKKILVDTAASEVNTSGKAVKVDPSVGGKVLRVDNAVLKVVNDQLAAQGKKPIKLEDVEKVEAISVVAIGKSPKDYTIKATVGSILSKPVDVSIQMNGQGAIGGESKKRITAPGEVTWGFSFMGDKDQATLLVRRLDNNACSRLSMKQQGVLGGKWTGSSTLDDVELPGLAGAPPELIAQARAAMGIGRSYPAELVFEEQTPESGKVTGTGEGGTTVTQYAFKDNKVTMEYTQSFDGQVSVKSSLVAQVKESGGGYVMEGSWTGSAAQAGMGTAMVFRGSFKATKAR